MSKKMQNVNFKSIDEFFDFLPTDELEITLSLREILLECIIDCKEYLSFNTLYYKKYQSIAFIWPSSILWGSKKTYQGVRLGFTKGFLINDEFNYLSKGNRKQVYWKDFTSIAEINDNLIRKLVINAVEIDDELVRNKRF